MTGNQAARPLGVVALGASAGGIGALQRACERLPVDLPLAVCVVLHIPATPHSLLADIIGRRAKLSVSRARDGEPLRAHHVHVAPPDHHLVVGDGHVRLDRGPKENGTRPAIDPLFRSVASAYGRRGAAVVLSGALADGAAGAAAVAAAGGRVLVQDPADATVPSMPEAALRAVPGARVLAAGDLAEAIVAFASDLASAFPDEGDGTELDPDRPSVRSRTRPEGAPSGFTCPECHGPLWARSAEGVAGFRCRVGHAYVEDVLLEEKDVEIEAALWSAVEALEEQAELLRKVALRLGGGRQDRASDGMHRRADTAERRADVLRGVLATAHAGSEPEPELA
jgi:two-component system chemotaxis response regulator CheB